MVMLVAPTIDNFIQAVAGNRPTYTNDGSGQNGRPFLDFVAASNTRLGDNAYAGWAAGTGTYMAVVINNTSTSGTQYVVSFADAGAANSRARIIAAQSSNTSGTVYLGTTDENTGTAAATTGAQVIEVFRNTVTDKLELWRAGVRLSQSSAVAVDTTGDTPVEVMIGDSAWTGAPFDGHLYEVVVANVDPTNAQLAQLSDYWHRRYGLKGCSKLTA